MKKVAVIGCPGAGKSVFSRKLAEKTHLPLYYLDMIWHLPDKTNISRDEFRKELGKIIGRDEWIIDGTYLHTLEMRLERCDTVFFLDLPVDICLEGAMNRVGRPREDMPWQESEIDPDFYQWILDFPEKQLPIIRDMLASYRGKLNVIEIRSREEADAYLNSI